MKEDRRKSPHRSVFPWLGGYVMRLHHDDRGAIAVLVLLTLWCLIALIGMVWNTAEFATRRQQMQTAADSAAYDSATSVARAVNAVAAQNILICQDASAEAIWRAVPLTQKAIWLANPNPQNLIPPPPLPRLNQEIQQANALKAGNSLGALLQRMQQALTNIAVEQNATIAQLNALQADAAGAHFASRQEQADFNNEIRQARSVMSWVSDTYVNGKPVPPPVGGAPNRPGPPGPNGQGLVQLLLNWQAIAGASNIIPDYILAFIQGTPAPPNTPPIPPGSAEIPLVTTFINQTASATARHVDLQMQAHEETLYTNEMALNQTVADTVETQRAQAASFYQADITLATLRNSPGNAGPASVAAPLISADQLQSVTIHDTIRNADVSIDPINPHTLANRIWHPNVPIPVDPVAYPYLNNLTLNCNMPDDQNLPNRGWGHIWAYPLEHYTHQRVINDSAIINQAYMAPLDQARSQTLASAIRQMLGIPGPNITIPNLPNTLPDDQPEPPPLPPPPPPPPATAPAPPPPGPPVFDQIPILPQLTQPAGADAAFRAILALYRQHGAAYTSEVRSLRTNLLSYINFYANFTEPFASRAWNTSCTNAANDVLEALGTKKHFVVLSTYNLSPIPQWAQSGMFANAAIQLEDQIVIINIQPITQQIVNNLIQTDPLGLGRNYLDPVARQAVLFAAYIGQASADADALVRAAAHQVALDLAGEWVNRPWPYEITPPLAPVPPYQGMTRADRQTYFTILAGARQTAPTAPAPLLQKIFGSAKTQLVAYAQAEAFNGNEFNPSYGSSERFDQVVPIPEITYYPWNLNLFVGSPRAWRISSPAGWNWHARLSLSDALPAALQNNSDLRSYLHDAGITNPDPTALNYVNLH